MLVRSASVMMFHKRALYSIRRHNGLCTSAVRKCLKSVQRIV